MISQLQSLLLSTSYNLKSTLVLLALVFVLTMVYAVRLVLKGRVHYARVDKQGGSALLSKGLMEMAYWWLQPLARFLVALGITPNMISWTSLVFGLLAGICLAFGHFGFGGACAVVSGFMDSLDGMVARLTGVSSDAGEVLDATIDRYAEGFFISGLVIYYRDIPVLQVLALMALMGSFMVSYSSAKAEALNVDPPKGSMRRPERAVYLTLGAILSPITIAEYEYVRDYPIAIGFPMVIALGMIAVLANASAIERMAAIAKEMRKREAEALRLRRIAAAQADAELDASTGADALAPSHRRH
ncbi:MAG: CDP-alcohol phosphatidyltransferase family protein [Cryobacterium sp.]|nr:CDP-alcohol phosphatidyltransferase family protein [Oligoflexia bacterium]